MDAFVDLTLLPDPEFPATTLMNALFSKLHRGLVGHGEGTIGVSFPDVEDAHRGLGSRLRLHGSAADLRDFHERTRPGIAAVAAAAHRTFLVAANLQRNADFPQSRPSRKNFV